MLFPSSCEQFAVRLKFYCGLAALMFGVAQPASAQSDARASVPAKNDDSQSPTGPDIRFRLIWNSSFGKFTYIPETWAQFQLSLENSLNVPRNIVCATSFDEQPNLQFGRRVWLPPRSKLQISHPVLIPKSKPPQGDTAKLHSLVIDGTAADEVLVKNDTGQLVHDEAILLTQTLRNTGIIAPPNARPADVDDVSNLVIAGRVSQGLSNQVTVLADNFLPAEDDSLDYLDHIVVAENRLLDDFAGLSALRRWLSAGGHLWIMLDRVDPMVLERLLGDSFSGHVVDRVGLTTVRVDKAPTLSMPDGQVGESAEYDDPVEMTRLIVNNMDVSYSVNGWPAAMSTEYGEGRVFITTLGPRGWMKTGTAIEHRLIDPYFRSTYVPCYPMSTLAKDLFDKRQPDLLPQNVSEPMVREYIGYAVPTWGLIVGILFCFLLSLIATGVWLLRIERLEHLGWVGSTLAVASSAILLTIGWSYRHSVPGTIASVQLAQTLVGTDDVRTHGMIAVYHPEGSRSEIESTHGGRIWPDMTGLENTHLRMMTTDLGQSHWENLAQSAGLRTFQFTTAETVIDRIEAHATFDANGIVGTYAGRLAAGTDAMVATSSGRIGVNFRSDGSFVARADNVFERDQYLGASFLSDEQARRRRTLEKMLSNPKRKDYPNRPQLMFWSDRWDHGFRFGDDLKRQGATLMCAPLVINRPPNGTDVLIPWPLLRFHVRSNPDGSPPSAMWDYNRNEWQERSVPSSTWLSFQIPKELTPLTAGKARVDITVSGPVGRIEIMGLKKGAIASLHTVIDPVGSLSFEIDDAEVLSISHDGLLDLGLRAGDPARPELTSSQLGSVVRKDAKVNYWKIQSLTLQLWAKTTEPTLKD